MSNLRYITARDLVGRIEPGTTVYDGDNKPQKVNSVRWFGDYDMDIIICENGRSYPATTMRIARGA